jgi:hypothetical protein
MNQQHCKGVVNFMGQQLKAIKDLEDLIAHNKEQGGCASVAAENIEILESHVTNMKISCDTALTLAKHYGGKAKEEAKPAGEAQSGEAAPRSKRNSAKKQEAPKEEPPENDDDDLDFLD